MSWTNILLAAYDQDSPVTETLLTAIIQNISAIMNGDSGAPRLLDAALGSTVTTAGTDWTRLRYAGAAAGSVGSLVFGRGSSGKSYGQTDSGSNIRPTNAAGTPIGSTLSGTWRCLGHTSGGNEPQSTLWLRIS